MIYNTDIQEYIDIDNYKKIYSEKYLLVISKNIKHLKSCNYYITKYVRFLILLFYRIRVNIEIYCN